MFKTHHNGITIALPRDSRDYECRIEVGGEVVSLMTETESMMRRILDAVMNSSTMDVVNAWKE